MGEPNKTATEAELEEMIAATDTGARSPEGIVGTLLFAIALAWALFQLWIASPIPFMMKDIGIPFTDMNLADIIPATSSIHNRPIHLAFAMCLAFLAYPTFKRSPRSYIPFQDWIMAIVAVSCSMYLAVFAVDLAERPGLPTTTDLIISAVGIVMVLEAARRSLGPPLMVIAAIFLCYVFFGHMAPEVIAWKGASFEKAMSHMWITTEGAFGVALGVSTSMVFLFVLFGSLLERAGAGNYFIWVAFSLLGHFKGGPAKAAVVSSAMTGLVSGSSIANVVTTGTFTIPLMKRVGFPAEKAGAVEVASSTNGQLTPPVMGAAAFLMIEFVGISYIEVIKHAFLPAVVSYIALVYIVHLEACKAGLEGLPRAVKRTLAQSALVFVTVVLGIIVLSLATYYLFGWVKGVFGENSLWIAATIITLVYLALVKFSTKFPSLASSEEISVLPQPGPIVKSGLYYLLPVVVLVWCLTVERLSPAFAAFYATLLMIFITFTHKPLRSFFLAESEYRAKFKEGFNDVLEGMVAGSRNMIGIGVATACAGLILGTVSLTGIGQVMADFVEVISAGNVILMLLFTAGISLLLGMGLPTTANYIVVSSLMAPVIIELGAGQGLIVPLIAVHLFVFYFGILADDTPPVGLAAYAAAAISGGDPIKTGIQGFTYDIRTAALPFIFIFNTELLMIGITGPIHLLTVIVTTLVSMLLFAAATQGWFLTKTKAWETVLLLLISFTFVRPGFWMDMVYPPLEKIEATKIYDVVKDIPAKEQVRVHVVGETLEGKAVDKVVMLPVGEANPDGKERLSQAAGLELREENGKMIIDNIVFGSASERQKLDFDWEIVDVQVKADRPPKQWFYIPALILLVVVIMSQRRRSENDFKPAAV